MLEKPSRNNLALYQTKVSQNKVTFDKHGTWYKKRV